MEKNQLFHKSRNNMQRFLNSLKEFFSKYFTSNYLQVIILIFSVIIVIILTPFSITQSNEKQSECDLDLQIYLTQIQSTIYSNFTSFLDDTLKSVDIALSFPDEIKEFPKFWKDTFKSLHERQISVRIFTNNKNLKFDSYVDIRYLQKSPNDHGSFNMNFAISDKVDIFFPSTFYVNENIKSDDRQEYSYIAHLSNCNSAGRDLSALFDILWTQKSEKRKALKHSYIPGNSSEKIVSFYIDPLSEFPIGLPNITSSLYNSMSLLYSYKFILSHSIFPDLSKSTSNKERIDLSHKSAKISSLFEVSKELFDDQETYLMVPRNHFNDHKNQFLSMISNMDNESILVCDNTDIQGTIIGSSSSKINKLLLLSSGISNVYSGDMVLGFSLNVDSFLFENLAAIFDNNTKCKNLIQPTIKI